MENQKTGLIFEAWDRKDHSFERIFGASGAVVDVKPLGRSIDGIPVIVQEGNSCVVCTVTWIRQWISKNEGEEVHLSWPFLAKKSNLSPEGASPKQVLEPARKEGIATWQTFEEAPQSADAEALGYRVRGYSFVTDYSKYGLYSALQKGPLAIGILNFKGIGNHMMAAFDVTEDGKRLVCANWWGNGDKQDIQEVAFEDVEMAVSFAKAEQMPENKTIPLMNVLFDKVMSALKYQTKKVIVSVLALMVGTTGVYGAGYAPVTGYSAKTTQYITASQTTIPVNSVLDKSGSPISISSISSSSTKYMYFNLEPGNPSREELTVCTGISGNNLTGCLRGVAFQGSTIAASSTLAFAHNPGASIIMTNIGAFYANEFVSINGDQTVFDVKTFAAFPKTTSTTAVPSSDAQFANKYYVDNVGAGGFTAANVSTTLGILATGSVPEKVGINASGTTGLGFDSSSGKLYLNVSSTGGLAMDTATTPASIYLNTGRDFTFTGALTAAGSLIVNNTPTTNLQAANKTYIDSSLQLNSATGTAGENVTAGQGLYVSSTGSLYLADADATTSTYSFVGIALNTTNTSGIVTYARPGGIITNQSGLTAGQYYYLSGTPGSLVTPGASGKVFARVGYAISATNMLVMRPTFEQMANGSNSLTFDGSTTTVSLGFVPKEVELECSGQTAAAGSSWGNFVWNQAGTARQVSQGIDDNSSPFTIFSSNRACKWQEGGTDLEVIVSTTTNGFSMGAIGTGVSRTVYWRAKYWDNGFGGN